MLLFCVCFHVGSRDLNTGPLLGVSALPFELSPLADPLVTEVNYSTASEEFCSWRCWVFENCFLFWFLKKCLISHKTPKSHIFLTEVSMTLLSPNSRFCLAVLMTVFFPLMTDMVLLCQWDPCMRVRMMTSTLFSLRLSNGPQLSQRMQDIKSFGLVFLYFVFGHRTSAIPPTTLFPTRCTSLIPQMLFLVSGPLGQHGCHVCHLPWFPWAEAHR